MVPRETIYLDAIEGGRVEQVLVEAGDMGREGQPLVRLSNTELELVVLDREARLIESITQLQARQSQLEQDRLNNLKQLAAIEYNVASLRARLTVARRCLRNPRNNATPCRMNSTTTASCNPSSSKAMNVRKHCVCGSCRRSPRSSKTAPGRRHHPRQARQPLVLAPVAGRMTAIDLKIGENRNRGERLGELTPESGFKVVAVVDEFYLGRLRAGQTATGESAREFR